MSILKTKLAKKKILMNTMENEVFYDIKKYKLFGSMLIRVVHYLASFENFNSDLFKQYRNWSVVLGGAKFLLGGAIKFLHVSSIRACWAISVARTFDWVGWERNHNLNAMTSSEIFKRRTLCGIKIL